jgi:hypothetical protein
MQIFKYFFCDNVLTKQIVNKSTLNNFISELFTLILNYFNSVQYKSKVYKIINNNLNQVKTPTLVLLHKFLKKST